jgi:hypothetical protein
MPNSFSRFLTADELQEFRRQYLEQLSAGNPEPETEQASEVEA